MAIRYALSINPRSMLNATTMPSTLFGIRHPSRVMSPRQATPGRSIEMNPPTEEITLLSASIP